MGLADLQNQRQNEEDLDWDDAPAESLAAGASAPAVPDEGDAAGSGEGAAAVEPVAEALVGEALTTEAPAAETAAADGVVINLDTVLGGAGALEIPTENLAPATKTLEEQAQIGGDPTLPEDHPRPAATLAPTGDEVVLQVGGPEAEKGTLEARFDPDAVQFVGRIERNAPATATPTETSPSGPSAPSSPASPAETPEKQADGEALAEADEAPTPSEPPVDAEEEELRRLGLDKEALRAFGGLSLAARAQFLAELKGRRAASDAVRNRVEALKQQARQPAGGGSFLGALIGAFRRDPQSAEMRSSEQQIKGHSDFLSPEAVRNRIAAMRRGEILGHASSIAEVQAKMKAAAQKYNDALFATEAGKAFQAALGEVQARRPDLTPSQILSMARDGTLAGFEQQMPAERIREAMADPAVKSAWQEFEELSKRASQETAAITEKMAAFEEHLPGHSDTQATRQSLDEMFKAFEESFAAPVAAPESEAAKKLKERLQEIAKSMEEFVGRVLSVLRIK